MSKRCTKLSFEYRQRAAEVGLSAMKAIEDAEMMRLLHQALSWIQLAENEETIADAERLDRMSIS